VEGIDVACYDVKPPLQRLEKGLQSWVTLLILPLFALANSGIVFKDIDVFHSLTHPVIWGIALGLFVGKPLGISLFVFLTQKFLKTPLPGGVSWLHMLGVSMLAGIGFTMSLFISGLSFTSAHFTELSKMGIILGSLLSGILGFAVLRMGEALRSTS
jgi:NhaA family Na+:H+ antiporter